MHNNLLLEGEAGERYEIIRSFNFGKNLNVYKAYKINEPKVDYVIKHYKTKDAFERELLVLRELSNATNIMQMIDSYPSQPIIVCECALYDLETFLGHQDYSHRHEEEGVIIKDLVSGLSELHAHNIVHTELAPKNIMYFQEKDGFTERWKLIDFDTACFADKDHVKLITNYSAPEVIRAHENKTGILANFSMDMFSLGLILYFLETGQHYWDGENEVEKKEIISEKYLPLRNVHGSSAYVIKRLLNKNISSRMTLKQFMQTPYYTGEGELAKKSTYKSDSCPTSPTSPTTLTISRRSYVEEPMNINKCIEYDVSHRMSETDLLLYQAKINQETFKIFLEKYHDEMKQSLKIMNDKIDGVAKAVGDLTKKIPQWLVKVKNEKVPRVFVMVPDQKDWKKPATWFFSRPFRLLFVCEHKEQWHVPEQEGYKVLEVPQFIKKYGPWINLCLQALTSIVRIMTSNIFPQGVADILSSVFSIVDNSDLMQYFQEIIDTIDIGVKTMADQNPEFNPLSNESNIPCQTINATGLRELKKFLDTQESADHFGGLVQCVDEETEEILWLCEEHRDGYRVKTTEKAAPLIQVDCPPRATPTSDPPKSSRKNKPSLTIPLTPPASPVDISPTRSPSPRSDYSKFYTKNLTDPLHPLNALEYVHQILCEVIGNADVSGRKHFRTDMIREIAQKMRSHINEFKNLCPNWHDNDQKVIFLSILENKAHLYIHFLRLIVRYCVVVDDASVVSITKQMSFLCRDLFEINDIIAAGKSFNKHLSTLVKALKESQYDCNYNVVVQAELGNFANEPKLKVNIDDGSNVIGVGALSQWYHTAGQAYVDHVETPSAETEIQGGGLFITTKRLLDYRIVTARSFKYLNINDNFSCVEKEIFLYNEHQLNENDYIIEFRGYSIHNCKPILFYDYSDMGDLFTYFQVNDDSSGNLLKDWKEKIKLAWKISQGVKYLHEKNIVHLDLRSASILLKYDECDEYGECGTTLTPKITNFFWSRDTCANKTFVYPKITISTNDKVWRRWYDPDRLLNEDEQLLTQSDIYSLGLLFWEIAWCKAGNLPFKDVPIKRLYSHLQKNKEEMEKLPVIPGEYRRWERLIRKMWQFNPKDRDDITAIEPTMGSIFRGRPGSMSSLLSVSSVSTVSTVSTSKSRFF